jgi:hypothetical protein
MKTPLELLQALLSNPTDIEHVRSLTTEDVTYVSLNFENPELHKLTVTGRSLTKHWRPSQAPDRKIPVTRLERARGCRFALSD